MKITVVSPHRGDAAFAVGLSIEAWLAQGHTVEVLNCFTRSEFAPYSDAGSVHANDRASFVSAVRKREDEAWSRRHGTAKLTLTDLNLKDAPLRLHHQRLDGGTEDVPGRVGGTSVAVDASVAGDAPVTEDASEKIVKKIRRGLWMSKAAALVLPLGLSGHVDHLTARNVALSAMQAEGPVAFYEELPGAASAQAQEKLDETIQTAVSQLTLAVQSTLQPVFAREACATRAAVEDAVTRKRRIAWCYDSQIDEAVTTEIAIFCERYEGRERMWGNEVWRSMAWR